MMYSTSSNVHVTVNWNTPKSRNTSLSLCVWSVKGQPLQLKQATALQHLLTAPIEDSSKLRPTDISQPFFDLAESSPQMGRSTHLCAFPLIYKASCLVSSLDFPKPSWLAWHLVHRWCHFATSAAYTTGPSVWDRRYLRENWSARTVRMRAVLPIPKSLIRYAHTVKSFAGDLSGVQIHAGKVFVGWDVQPKWSEPVNNLFTVYIFKTWWKTSWNPRSSNHFRLISPDSLTQPPPSYAVCILGTFWSQLSRWSEDILN